MKSWIILTVVLLAIAMVGTADARRTRLYPDSQESNKTQPQHRPSNYYSRPVLPAMAQPAAPTAPADPVVDIALPPAPMSEEDAAKLKAHEVSMTRDNPAPTPEDILGSATTVPLGRSSGGLDGADATEANYRMRQNFSDFMDNAYIRAEGGQSEEGKPHLLGSFAHGFGPISAEYVYTGEVFTNTRGGIRTKDSAVYMGLFEMIVLGDVEKMGCIGEAIGGSVFLYALNAHGRGISEYYIGDTQVISNIELPAEAQIFQMEEFWWERSFLDDLVSVRLGKSDANYDFAVVEVAGDFCNSSFGFHPTIPMPSYPDAAMGVVLHFQLTENLLFRYGLWDGAASGKTWGFSGTGETFAMYELERTWEIHGKPGEFHVGLWEHTGTFENPINAAITYRGNHGLHLGGEQMIVRESRCGDDGQGLAIFGQFGWSPQERNEVQKYIGAGVVYLGLLPQRDEDVVGLGMARVEYSDLFPRAMAETTIELFYKAQVSEFLMIQPDFQYVCSPGGTSRDAFAVGLRFELLL